MINDKFLRDWCRMNQIPVRIWDDSAPIIDRINYLFFSSLVTTFSNQNKAASIREVFAYLNDNSPKSVFSLVDDEVRVLLNTENIPYYIYDMHKSDIYENSYMSIYNSEFFARHPYQE